MSVIVTVEFNAKPGLGPTLAAGLSKAIRGTVANPACSYANVGVDEAGSDHLVIQMIWDNSDAHKAYTQGVMADPKMAPVMEMMAGPPIATYYTLAAHEDQG